MIVQPTIENINAAAEILRRDGLVAFPTETVYGLGANAISRNAVEAIYAAKGRPSSNPLIVHVAEIGSIAQLAHLDDSLIAARLEKIKQLWPGPLAVVLPAKAGIAVAEVSRLSTVAVRIPDHVVAQELIRRAGLPIAAPSANPSNFISPTSALHVEEFLGSKVELILDGGVCKLGIESTVVDLSSKFVRVLRPGFILPETIEMLLAEHVEVVSAPVALSPGQAATHYSPQTKLSFASMAPANISELRFGYISFRQSSSLPDNLKPSHMCNLSPNENLTSIASGLYSALHHMDQMQLDWILVDQCVNSGLGMAIMDRLSRAISKEN